jgi:hypothetical protein
MFLAKKGSDIIFSWKKLATNLKKEKEEKPAQNVETHRECRQIERCAELRALTDVCPKAITN